MLKKLINRNEGSQLEMNDSALRDIIPSNDMTIIKKPRPNQFSSICKILILMFFLGLVAIGIVLLALILAFSGQSFMNYIIHSSSKNFLPLSNNARIFPIDQENLPATINEQKWEKITVIPINNNQTVQSTKQQQINTRNDEQWTLIGTPTTQENQITTADITSTLFIQKTSDYKKIPFQSSTNSNKKKLLLAKYRKVEDDHMIDDLLHS